MQNAMKHMIDIFLKLVDLLRLDSSLACFLYGVAAGWAAALFLNRSTLRLARQCKELELEERRLALELKRRELDAPREYLYEDPSTWNRRR